MADTPADNPAVARPKAALTNNAQLLVAPGVLAKVKAPPQKKPARNEMEAILRRLYPNGSMDDVSVVAYNGRPNIMVKGVAFGAWTQSATLIYYNGDVDDISSFDAPYVLHHEASHIVQFRKNQNTRPASFEKMLHFEMMSYPKTTAWLESKAGRDFYTEEGWDLTDPDYKLEYSDLIKGGRDFSAAISLVLLKSVAGLLGRFAQRISAHMIAPLSTDVAQALAPNKMTREHIILHNMAQSEFVPAVKTGPSGNLEYYETADLYRPGDTTEDIERFRALGWMQ